MVAPRWNSHPAIGPSISESIIYSVAINSAGAGLIGGVEVRLVLAPPSLHWLPQMELSPCYRAFHHLESSSSVAINSAGAGLIGGMDSVLGTGPPTLHWLLQMELSSRYRAFHQLEYIHSVAINSAGAGLIGGYDGVLFTSSAYAALVAPNGTLTLLSGLFHQRGIIQ